jgi:hypothetical protein
VSVQAQITELLIDAGATEGALSHWWGTPHPDLNHFSPRHALELFPDEAAAHVVALARTDAADLKTATAGPVGAPAAGTPQPHAAGGRSRCRTE